MSLSDPIANLLTNIRNASSTNKESVEFPASTIGQKILEIFKADGYIEDFRLIKDNKQGVIKVYLKYLKNKKPAIIGVRRISMPSLRRYVRRDRIPRVINGLGTAVISTSKGVITDRDARKLNVGGEIICYIW